jgi:hypothetical protein
MVGFASPAALLQSKLGVKVRVLDPTPNCPASTVAEQVLGSFRDAEAVKAFAQGVDVLTVEIEHIDVDALEVGGGWVLRGLGVGWVRGGRGCGGGQWGDLHTFCTSLYSAYHAQPGIIRDAPPPTLSFPPAGSGCDGH